MGDWAPNHGATQNRGDVVRFLTPDEARRLLTELPEHLRNMAQFALSTGLWQRNVSFLRWDQVDMGRRVAWIHPDEAKAGRAIGVPLNEDALDVLRRRLGRHGDYVFTYQGKPVDRCSTKAWKRALEWADIEPTFRWHDLRHTWASWHVQSGTPLMELGSWGVGPATTWSYVMRTSQQIIYAGQRAESMARF